jgi:hypothetical protein
MAIIGGLNVLKVFDRSHFVFAFACLAFMALAASILLSIFVLRPRGNFTNNTQLGEICDPVKIAQKDCKEYVELVKTSDDETLLENVAVLIYDRSMTNKKKYYWLNREIWVGMSGWALSLIVVFLKVFA